MSLQRRLTLFFIVIVIFPLAVAGFFVRHIVVDELARRAELSLNPPLNATVAVYNERTQFIEALVRDAVTRPEIVPLIEKGSPSKLRSFLRSVVADTEGVDWLALKVDGTLTAFAREQAFFAPGFEEPTPQQMVTSELDAGPGYVRSPELDIEVEGKEIAAVVGGFWVDRGILSAAATTDQNLSIVSNGMIIASTVHLTDPVQVDTSSDEEPTFEATIGEDSLARAADLPGGMSLVASTPSGPIDRKSHEVLTYMIGLLVVAILGASALAYLLARLITQPLEELSEGARAVAEGRFDHEIPVRSRDEVGKLATAFNHMTARLRETIGELSSSRDQLGRAVRRVGETLRSTHDMNQLLDSIVNTVGDAVDADAVVVWNYSPSRRDLGFGIARGIEVSQSARVKMGEGIVGKVAERGETVMVPGRDKHESAPAEPPTPVTVAIPMYSQDRVMAVLALHRFNEDRPFTAGDLDTALFLVEQGGVAIENVALHEEAQRLSLTDGLTGIHNRRYFQMQFRQVLATSIRYERPFSLLMMDLDRFKAVNDTFGHQRGDEILIEFAQRVAENLREVDTFARYGGEEFTALLSETDSYGALTTAEKIRDAIRSRPFGGPGEQPISLTVSIGAASYPEHGDSFKDLIEAADRAMYSAKEEGRDRVRLPQKPPPQSPLRIAK